MCYILSFFRNSSCKLCLYSFAIYFSIGFACYLIRESNINPQCLTVNQLIHTMSFNSVLEYFCQIDFSSEKNPSQSNAVIWGIPLHWIQCTAKETKLVEKSRFWMKKSRIEWTSHWTCFVLCIFFFFWISKRSKEKIIYFRSLHT